MSEPRIVFDHVWKKFHRGEIHDSLRDLIPAIARRLVGRRSSTELGAGDFWAVRDLSFDVRPGQTLGIIGPNGSGKSTTLKLLTRIMQPTHGLCEVVGRAGALIEVSAGFHGDLTGRENVYLQGAIMGMRSADIARKFDDIVAFSGISESIDTPVKRYSSGMNARLGFSIAAHIEPDVLIIDEVLAVGDLSFQERAFGRIRDMARSGIPVIIVSHQLDRIAELCTDAILLTRGEVAARGAAPDVIATYVGRHAGGASGESSGPVRFDALRFSDSDTVESGGQVTVLIEGSVLEPLDLSAVNPILLRVRSLKTGGKLYETSAIAMRLGLVSAGRFSVRGRFQANVPPGKYSIEVTTWSRVAQREISFATPVVLEVTDPGNYQGSNQLNASMDLLEQGRALDG